LKRRRMGREEIRKGFFVGFLAIADLCVLRVSAFQGRDPADR